MSAQHQGDDLLRWAEQHAWHDEDAAERFYGKLVYQREQKRWIISGLEPQVAIIMSLRSGAGLDGLQHRCSTVAHGELDWSAEVHKQLRGRLRPHARKDAITEIYFVADSGSDPAVAAVQGLKASQAHGIIDPKRGVVEVQTDESRIKVLAQMYLDRAKAKAAASDAAAVHDGYSDAEPF